MKMFDELFTMDSAVDAPESVVTDTNDAVVSEVQDLVEVSAPVVQEPVVVQDSPELAQDDVFGFVKDEAPEEPAVVTPPSLFYTHGGQRYQLVAEGVCVACAHCGQPLTDADSVERGIGPICSKKGYNDEVEPRDDAEAMVALAEFPELLNYLVTKYKAKGNRALVNGLTRTASLNRRTPVHSACTDAIDALGYKRLASALRESICTVELYDIKENENVYGFWIKRCDFSWNFWNRLKTLPGVYMTKFPKRQTIVPKEHRKALAELLVQHYSGLYVKTPKGSFKITPGWFQR